MLTAVHTMYISSRLCNLKNGFHTQSHSIWYAIRCNQSTMKTFISPRIVIGRDQNLRDFAFHHLQEPRNSWMTIVPIFLDLKVTYLQNFVWFQLQLLKLWELAVKEIWQFRTEVKCDSVKCKKLLSGVNCCLVMYLKFN